MPGLGERIEDPEYSVASLKEAIRFWVSSVATDWLPCIAISGLLHEC